MGSDRPGPRAWPVRVTRPGAASGPSGAPPSGSPPPGTPSHGPGRVAWVVAALSAIVLLGAVGAVLVRVADGGDGLPLPAAGLRSDARSVGVRAALAVMTRGLRAHDESVYLSAVDHRDGALAGRQRAMFRGLQALPAKDPQLVWDGERSRVPDRPARYPAGALTVIADVRYLLDGWDDESVDDGVVLTLAPVGSRWLVVADTEEAGGAASRRFVEPWTTGAALAVERRAHVLVVGEAVHRSQLRRLADRLERVTADVRARWPEPSWNGRVVAYALSDPRFVQAWFASQAATGPSGDRPGAAPTWEARVGRLARAGTGSGDSGDGPPRLVVTPYLLGRPEAHLLTTLRHEVTHVATARTGRPVPGWLSEGAAEYTGSRLGGDRVDALRTFAAHGLTAAASRQLRGGVWAPQLLDDPQAFYSGTGAAVAAGYLDGWIAALYVADRYGDATLRALYDAAASQPESASWDAVDAEALRTVLHTDHAAFTDAVARYGTTLYRSATTPP